MPQGGFANWGYSDPTGTQDGDFWYRIDLGRWRYNNKGTMQNVPEYFTKGGLFQSPSASSFAVWVAPFACTVTKVRGYQDSGTGSVLTALHGTLDLLVTDITISQAAAWQDGGTVQNASFASGDILFVKFVSVSGSPNYASVQVDFVQV